VHLLEEFEKKNPGLSHIRISVFLKIWRLFIWQKFELKNVISTNTKDFFMGKIVQIRQISKRKKNSNRQISTISFSR
jgi:hypothetical protein